MTPSVKKTDPDKTTENTGSDTDDTEATDPYYCPGCGRRYGYQTECRGMSAATPHPPIEVVSTDELKKGADTDKHTPAPDSPGA